ncbi:MAG: ABC transporter substrate-binding protein [Lysinibacillus sp.]
MNKLWKFAGATALAAMLVACSAEEETKAPEKEEKSQYPLTVTDAVGNEVTIEAEPERIISLAPSNTEILYALGLEEQIVGLTTNDNYPPEVSEKPTVGDMEFNVEEIINLTPDLVLVHESGMFSAEALIEQLTALDIDVYVVNNAESFDATYATFEAIGELTNKEQEATELIEDVKEDVAEVVATVEGQDPKKAFVVVGTDPDIYVAGQKTFLNEMLQVINVENAVQEEGWPLYSAEDFVAANPDSLIFTYAGDDQNILTNKAFSTMAAVKNNALTVVDGDTTSRQGPRIGDGLEEMAKAIYPDAFSN